MRLTEISPEVWTLSEQVEAKVAGRFAEIDTVAKQNTMKVLDAFHEFRVSDSYFAGTTGYGYDDKGRDMLDAIYARVFGAEKALVRIGFVNGSHAISSALYGATEPGKILLSVTGTPYDTLRSVIGITGDEHGSMKYYGIRYDEVALKDGEPDYAAIEKEAANPEVSTVMIQRSRGYANRRALQIADIQQIVKTVRAVNPKAVIFVDNCYGEFTETMEPPQVGVDLIAGSLIKNPGGGLAPTGGYIAGRADLVDRAANRMTTPGIGAECGSTLGNNRLLYQGFFMAPHITAQALKTAVFCAGMLEELGFKSSPGSLEPRSDIIQMIELQSPERLKRFCRGIQSGAPVDAYVTPEPWMMPGYDAEVIMAAGAFIQGSSIELSADGPMRPPYTAYLQGGLTYESGRLGILLAVSEMLDD
ncbi:MAG: aminotransferase class I/II-fold pyridoxal phosphate-dependent enzyme [Oscillospiraceae bacterium]|jgi:cystathionine beta-lyase family protein involved in aluminum resistance